MQKKIYYKFILNRTFANSAYGSKAFRKGSAVRGCNKMTLKTFQRIWNSNSWATYFRPQQDFNVVQIEEFVTRREYTINKSTVKKIVKKK